MAMNLDTLARPATGEDLPEEMVPGVWARAWRRLRQNRAAMISIGAILVLYGVAITSAWIAPYDPDEVHFAAIMNPPAWEIGGSWEFVLGTDGLGRDLVSRLIYGSRISMAVGLVPVIFYLVIGGGVGLYAGYRGGTADTLLMRVVDIFYALPELLVIITIVTFVRETALGNIAGGLVLLLAVLAAFNWVGTARLVRGQVLSFKQMPYVEAARALGASGPAITFKHIVPHVMAPIVVQMAFAIPGAILAEAVLSFIGIGIRPPMASWGNMVNEGYGALLTQPMMALAPAACIAVVTLAFTFLGDGLRDALDPHMRV